MSVVCVCWTDAAINDISFKNIFHLLQKSSWRCLTCFSQVNPQRLPWPSVDRALLATFDVEVVALAIHSELVEAPALSAMRNMPESFPYPWATQKLYMIYVYIYVYIRTHICHPRKSWLILCRFHYSMGCIAPYNCRSHNLSLISDKHQLWNLLRIHCLVFAVDVHKSSASERMLDMSIYVYVYIYICTLYIVHII